MGLLAKSRLLRHAVRALIALALFWVAPAAAAQPLREVAALSSRAPGVAAPAPRPTPARSGAASERHTSRYDRAALVPDAPAHAERDAPAHVAKGATTTTTTRALFLLHCALLR